MPGWVATIFGTSAITPCAIMAIVLNSILPPEPRPDVIDLRPDGRKETERLEKAIAAPATVDDVAKVPANGASSKAAAPSRA